MSNHGSSKRLRQLLPAAHGADGNDINHATGSSSSSANAPAASTTALGHTHGYNQTPGHGQPGLLDGDASLSEYDDRGKRKRIGTQLACNDCRRRKARCDGQRPSCQACLKRFKTCVYTEKPARGASDTTMVESYEVLQILKAAPEPEALDILRMLRANRDPSAVLAVLKDSTSSNPTPSEPGADHSYTNLSRSRFEHELMRNYPTAYPVIRPLPLPRPETFDASPAPYLRRTRSMDQRTILGIHLSGYGLPGDHMTGSSYLADTEDNPFLTETSGGIAPTLVPICDERLHHLDMSFWTDIPLSNEFATNVISLYLTTDHPLLGMFDPDLFVSDLVGHRDVYCSRFLVHALMYWGTFGNEAERLWWAAKSTDSLCSIAGAQLLSLAFMGNGRDHFVLVFLTEACRMARRMSLLGVEPTSLVAQNDTTAEIPERIPPIYMGETFTALCRFWRILHGVSMVYYNRNTSTPAHISEHVSIEFAERKYRELLAWIETLPSSFAQAEDNPHHVMTFHLWFHAAILDIFRPFLRDDKAKKTRLTTFSSRRSSAEAAFKASVNQLKRLIVVYRSQYQSSAYTILWHTALIYVANAVLKDTGDPEWRFYFLHCVYGYESLRKSYRLAEAIGRALLAMTLRNGDITGLEARTILQQLKQRGLDHPSGDIRATFMGDLELALTNPGEAKVETLAGQFEDVALFQEFIDMEATSHDDMFMDMDHFDESHTHRF
ncbi:Nitrogen assimilation transcription factor nit-4 like protein [Verticillium longisporum]|uniref:Nitrogen assimilation transcription factor nit-4 like protein n=1 Tax=Verticillium longisporum TaxID=100787 RepID=A0A8I2ZCV9_VERLO|nr:Nitrogen assimilation transcription factor nit-4 like protein [Verticillium longisporum]